MRGGNDRGGRDGGGGGAGGGGGDGGEGGGRGGYGGAGGGGGGGGGRLQRRGRGGQPLQLSQGPLIQGIAIVGWGDAGLCTLIGGIAGAAGRIISVVGIVGMTAPTNGSISVVDAAAGFGVGEATTGIMGFGDVLLVGLMPLI
ncbi:uncharacterized protein LOC131858168 [Cryptomeria japonica]|uniref:uncharacterized protein LOC131858168 n=1 Tax=Cryptomeria japonica TaxID=3369 RepID=UPI0027DA07F8|nr:uncharacterized protein LOC131858168 [Cryptomeria japonica]